MPSPSDDVAAATTAPVGAPAPAGTDPRLHLPGRRELLERLVTVLADAGVDWAWQGAVDAPDRWLASSGPADLDLWWRPGSRGVTDADDLVGLICRALPAAPVADARHPGRLRHTSLVVRADTGLAVIDLTHGDLRVGPIELVPAPLVTLRAGDGEGCGPRLTGAAAVADLLLRPLLRGRVPEPDRVALARCEWTLLPAAGRGAAVDQWRGALGKPLCEEVAAVLDGAPATPTTVARARRRLVRATVAPRSWGSSWQQRRTIVPAGGTASPLGLRGRGVVVALVGTDGSGKSTVAAQLRDRLEDAGFATADAYFGMARGNLPGIALTRRLLGVGGTAAAGPRAAASPTEATPAADRPALRRAAAWYYAAEYVWRYQRTVAPPRRRGRVVIVDRYVYDLRESPWPGSRASAVAERLVPRPDLLVLPDAPDDVIHARKPEREPHEQAAIQSRYRALVAEAPARYGHVVVDTSGASPDPVAGLELAVISAAHVQPGGSGRAAGVAPSQGTAAR